MLKLNKYKTIKYKFTIVHFSHKKGYRALGTIYPIRGNNVTTLRESHYHTAGIASFAVKQT